MQRSQKERVVEELTVRLRETESLLVADYRGLSNAQLADVRSRLREHGATLTVVKNSLTRRAAEAAGAEQLLALVEGPTAIAFITAGGDPVAAAKALADTAKDTKVLALRGGVLEGKELAAADVEALAKLPPVDILKGQLVGVIVAPLTQLAALLAAPLRDLVGLIDARIAQLEETGVEAGTEAEDAAPADADEPPAAEVAAAADDAEPGEAHEEAEPPGESTTAEAEPRGETTTDDETQTENEEE